MILTCDQCGSQFERSVKEYNRHKKRGHYKQFCSLKCSSEHLNSNRKRRVQIVKACEHCGNEFLAMTGSKEPRFCSRSCASKGSVTIYRRMKARETSQQNFVHGMPIVTAMIKKREAWKYVELEELLTSQRIPHEFELWLSGTNYLYDLALLEQKVIIEFDGPEHCGEQAYKDRQKAKAAEDQAWTVIRIPVVPNTVISPECIKDFIVYN